MFDWDDARYFLAVHRAQTLSAAARKIGVNQSTVGRRLESLESALGVRLFNRSSDGFTLTPAGEQFLPRAERIEGEIYATSLELSGREAKLTGSIRLTTPDALGPIFVTHVLVDFHAQFPDIELAIIADNRRLNLSRLEADMALRSGRPQEPSLVSKRLCLLANGLYAAPSYLSARGKPPPDFSGHDFVAHGDRELSSKELRWIEQNARKARVVLTTNNTIAALEAAVAGFGLTLLPCYLADVRTDLVRVLPPIASISEELWLLYHRDLRHAARIRVLVDFLAAVFANNGKRMAGTGSLRKP